MEFDCPICETELKDKPRIERRIGEPVIRPDGIVLELFVYHPIHTLNVALSSGDGWPFRVNEVLEAGNGNFQEGINRIGELLISPH